MYELILRFLRRRYYNEICSGFTSKNENDILFDLVGKPPNVDKNIWFKDHMNDIIEQYLYLPIKEQHQWGYSAIFVCLINTMLAYVGWVKMMRSIGWFLPIFLALLGLACWYVPILAQAVSISFGLTMGYYYYRKTKKESRQGEQVRYIDDNKKIY